MRSVGRELRGHAFTPPPDPPKVVTVPWCQLVLTHTMTTGEVNKTADLTFKGVFDALLSQLSITASPGSNLEMRISRAAVYCVDPSRVDALRCNFYSMYTGIDGTQNNPLMSLEDAPAVNHWARVGYQWPIAESLYVIQNTGSKLNRVIISTLTSNVSSQLLFHVHLMWRAHNAGPPSFIRVPVPTPISSSSALIDRLAQRLEEVIRRTELLEIA